MLFYPVLLFHPVFVIPIGSAQLDKRKPYGRRETSYAANRSLHFLLSSQSFSPILSLKAITYFQFSSIFLSFSCALLYQNQGMRSNKHRRFANICYVRRVEKFKNSKISLFIAISNIPNISNIVEMFEKRKGKKN